MANYKLTNKAVQDLKHIWNYTFDKWSEKQADRYYKAILNECEKACSSSHKGEQYSKLVEGLRGRRIGKHVIFYRILDEHTIEVERILHERMDLKQRLLGKQ